MPALSMRPRAFAVAVAVSVTASLVFVSGAVAATLTASGTTYTFNADAGEANDVTVIQDATTITFADEGAIVTADAAARRRGLHAGPARAASLPSSVTCPTAGITGITFNLGDQDDALDAGSAGSVTIPQAVNGGDGRDWHRDLLADGGCRARRR